jgi:hypothetical protein
VNGVKHIARHVGHRQCLRLVELSSKQVSRCVPDDPRIVIPSFQDGDHRLCADSSLKDSQDVCGVLFRRPEHQVGHREATLAW